MTDSLLLNIIINAGFKKSNNLNTWKMVYNDVEFIYVYYTDKIPSLYRRYKKSKFSIDLLDNETSYEGCHQIIKDIFKYAIRNNIIDNIL